MHHALSRLIILKINFVVGSLFLEIRSVSMGQGQEIHARNMISDCITNGGWVLLQNMHLSLPFCTEAMDALSDSEEIHSSFRMWITTEVHPQFPIALLQVNNIFLSTEI